MSYATHDHDWQVQNPDLPILEDNSVVFLQECTFAPVTGSAHSEKHDEVFREHGPECEAEDSLTFRATRSERKREGWHNVEYPFAPFSVIERAEKNGEVICSDPDPEYGQVKVETDEWIVIYEP